MWSTDLYRDPAPEVVRVVAAVTGTLRARIASAPVDEAMASPAPAQPAEPTGRVSVSTTQVTDTSAESSDASASSDPAASSDGPSNPDGEAKRVRRRFRRGGTERSLDDTDPGWGERQVRGDAHDRWLTEQRPPHWE